MDRFVDTKFLKLTWLDNFNYLSIRYNPEAKGKYKFIVFDHDYRTFMTIIRLNCEYERDTESLQIKFDNLFPTNIILEDFVLYFDLERKFKELFKYVVDNNSKQYIPDKIYSIGEVYSMMNSDSSQEE